MVKNPRLEEIVNETLNREDIPYYTITDGMEMNCLTLNRWISEGYPKTLRMFAELCKRFDVSADYLLFGEEDGKAQKDNR